MPAPSKDWIVTVKNHPTGWRYNLRFGLKQLRRGRRYESKSLAMYHAGIAVGLECNHSEYPGCLNITTKFEDE
jgi:hypothetical protein